MFTSDMVESTQERVTIKGVEPRMIGLLVNYAYTSKVSFSSANVQVMHYQELGLGIGYNLTIDTYHDSKATIRYVSQSYLSFFITNIIHWA